MIKNKRRMVSILFIVLLILVGVYAFVSLNRNNSKNILSEEGQYYKTFGESCLDRVTDDYLRNVCEKIRDSPGRDACYYSEGVSTGYDRICKLIENATLNQECLSGVNKTLANNKSLKQRAEKYNPYKRKI